jgi:hypothetical protein
MTTPVLHRRPESVSSPAVDPRNRATEETVSAHAPTGVEAKGDVRSQVMRNATTGVSTDDFAKIQRDLEGIIQDPSIRGASTEERQVLIQRYIAKTAEANRLSESQARTLREVLMDQEQAIQAKRAQELEDTVGRLANTIANKPFDAATHQEDLKAAFKEIQKVAGPATTHEDLKKIAERFDSIREGERQAMLYRELQALGSDSAVLGSPIDVDATKASIAAIRAKYPDVQASAQEMQKAFQSFYESAYDQKLSECNFLARGYYHSRYAVSSAGSAIASCFSWVGDAASGAKDAFMGGCRLVGVVAEYGLNAGKSAAIAGKDFAVKVYHDPNGAWEDVKLYSAATVEVVGEGLTAAGGALKKATAYGAEKGAKFWADFKESPWEATKSAVVATGGFLKGVSDSLGVSDMLVGVGHLGAAIPHMAYDFGAILMGKGSFSELGNNFKSHVFGVGTGILGGLTCFGEVTGIFDLGNACKHGFLGLAAYGRHDEAAAKSHAGKAAFHGAFAALSAGSIVATVTTGGAAAGSVAAVAAGRATMKEAAKGVLKTATKEFFETQAKTIGKATVSDMAGNALKNLSTSEGGQAIVKKLEAEVAQTLGAKATKESQQEALEQLALKHTLRNESVASATETLKGSHSLVTDKGAAALTTENVEPIAKEVSERRTKTLLQKLGVADSVDKHTYAVLVDIQESRSKDAVKKLVDAHGISKAEAEKMVKETKKALKSGMSDEAIKEQLEHGITKHITEVLEREMKDTYKDTFRKGIMGQVDEVWSKELREAAELQAKKFGKTLDSYADDLTEAAWKGAREGLEKATRAAVREGLERAFHRFRDRGSRLRGAGIANNLETDDGGIVAADGSTEVLEGIAHKRKGLEEAAGAEEVMTRQFEVVTASGDKVVYYERFNPASNKWEMVNSATISVGTTGKKAA